jgi:hypothetical protein
VTAPPSTPRLAAYWAGEPAGFVSGAELTHSARSRAAATPSPLLTDASDIVRARVCLSILSSPVGGLGVGGTRPACIPVKAALTARVVLLPMQAVLPGFEVPGLVQLTLVEVGLSERLGAGILQGLVEFGFV